jgi:hypothetical protein
MPKEIRNPKPEDLEWASAPQSGCTLAEGTANYTGDTPFRISAFGFLSDFEIRISGF